MTTRSNFGPALRYLRQATDLAQVDFGSVSSRTYVSTLERGLKQPTITKVDELAAVLGVHPMTLLALSYCPHRSLREVKALLSRIQSELETLAGNAQQR